MRIVGDERDVQIEEKGGDQMNSSIKFEIQQRDNPKKSYKFNLFRNGIMSIPGVKANLYSTDLVQAL